MNLILMLATLLANAVAIALIYQFVKRDDKRSQIIFMAISFGIIYIAVSIIYAISGIGIDKSVNEAAKNYMTFLFVPIDVILLVPFVATKYVKYRAKKIKKEELVKRIIIITLIGIVILTIECFAFKNMKQNIKTINQNIEQTQQTNKENNKEDIQVDNKENETNITNIIMNNLTNNVTEANDRNNNSTNENTITKNEINSNKTY